MSGGLGALTNSLPAFSVCAAREGGATCESGSGVGNSRATIPGQATAARLDSACSRAMPAATEEVRTSSAKPTDSCCSRLHLAPVVSVGRSHSTGWPQAASNQDTHWKLSPAKFSSSPRLPTPMLQRGSVPPLVVLYTTCSRKPSKHPCGAATRQACRLARSRAKRHTPGDAALAGLPAALAPPSVGTGEEQARTMAAATRGCDTAGGRSRSAKLQAYVNVQSMLASARPVEGVAGALCVSRRLLNRCPVLTKDTKRTCSRLQSSVEGVERLRWDSLRRCLLWLEALGAAGTLGCAASAMLRASRKTLLTVVGAPSSVSCSMG